MSKTVLFYLVGKDFQTSFSVIVQIFDDSGRLIADFQGKLPPFVKVRENLKLFLSHFLARFAPMRSATRIDTRPSFDNSVEAIQKADKDLGVSVDKWLNCDEMSGVREKLSYCLKDESEEIRFLFQTENPDLHCLPWHKWSFLREYYPEAEAGLCLPVIHRPQITPRDKVKILVVLGKRESLEGTSIDVESDWKTLKKYFKKNSNGELIRLDKPTLEEFCVCLETESPQIVFFAGHSSSEEDKADGSLALNENETLTIGNLESTWRNAVKSELQLVIVNSCDGSGVAHQLGKFGVPNIIAMSSEVPDKVAQKFLQHFIKEFVGGKPLFLAMRKARENLESQYNQYPGAANLPIFYDNPALPSLTWRSLGGIQANFTAETEKQRSRTESQNSPETGEEQSERKGLAALMKFGSVKQTMLCAAIATLVGLTQHILIVAPTQQKLALLQSEYTEQKFFCGLYGDFPTTMVRTSHRGLVPVLQWRSDTIPNPDKTCIEVSARFNDFYKDGNLKNYIALKNSDGYLVMCAANKKFEACTESQLLFKTLSGQSPQKVLEQLKNIQFGKTSSPIKL